MTDQQEQPLAKIDLGDGHFVSVHLMYRDDGGDERVGLAIGDDEHFLAAVLDPHEAALLAAKLMDGAARCRALQNVADEIARLAQEL